ncbi:ATP-dependent RNA helicase dbp6 [Cytospora mali]|uniref:ATP-dependent RNA helicase n=1 Tax=Cytospora mali TaxID=578113 RepID=A0A194VAJ9_CYTMA|nr:ATP-dependent RNA helicase dbp6 [Valsa mali var. pyri (nom. inval.)]
MYARYIPPPKASKPRPDGEQEVHPPPAVLAAISPAPAGGATPYARYVPPARKQPSTFAVTATPAPTNPTVPRPAPVSKTHLNAAAIPDPESLPAKIVFNYDEDEPSPSKRRKLSPEPAPAPAAQSKQEQEENEPKNGESTVKDKKKEKKEKKRKSKDQQDEGETTVDKPAKKDKKKKRDEQPFAFGFNENAATPDETIKGDTATSDIAESKSKDEKRSHPKTDDDAQAVQKNDHPDPVKKSGDGKKKSKKKAKEGDEEKDSVSARHKAVLDRASKYLKSSKDLEGEGEGKPQEEEQEPVEVHGLEPLPQPEPVVQDTTRPTYETLPGWIANPIRVTPETKASFTELGINNEVATKLQAKGYDHAFAVQTAVIPRLLPSPDRQGDVVVSAATGSGKTLAYVLPMVRDVSQGTMTRLRGLIVVPTRELVMQAKEVCEACAGVFSGPGQKSIKIGISMGNKQFDQEQADLVEEEQRYDPEGYQRYLQGKFDNDPWENLFNESHEPLPGHVIDHSSKVDILICTPGRLVDHIKRTPGFTLDYVRWLVVDEADKLLAQTFQDWVPVVMPLLSTTDKPGARDFPDSNKSGVRKIVLSATMTRDLTLLNGLKLHRPNLVILEGVRDAEGEQTTKTEHVLPELLEETAIKIRDANLKPLYLVDLLNSEHIAPINVSDDVEMKDAVVDDTSSSGSDSESGSSSDSDTSSDESSDDSDSDVESSPSRKRVSSSSKPFRSTVLIFTKSNETAVRLSRLLSLLSPNSASLIGTLTSTTRTSQRRKTLKAFSQQKLRILVASDLVARGIDLSNLDHVVNYDLPTSVASYVHRVGRTARAGRKGRAWTLFTKTEAGWFFTAIAGRGETKSKNKSGSVDGEIRRAGTVTEIRIDDRWDEGRVEQFESALETLGKEASEMRKRR